MMESKTPRWVRTALQKANLVRKAQDEMLFEAESPQLQMTWVVFRCGVNLYRECYISNADGPMLLLGCKWEAM